MSNCLADSTRFFWSSPEKWPNKPDKNVRPSVRTSTMKHDAATNQIVVFVKVDETFTMIWLSRSSEVRVKVRRWPQSLSGLFCYRCPTFVTWCYDACPTLCHNIRLIKKSGVLPPSSTTGILPWTPLGSSASDPTSSLIRSLAPLFQQNFLRYCTKYVHFIHALNTRDGSRLRKMLSSLREVDSHLLWLGVV